VFLSRSFGVFHLPSIRSSGKKIVSIDERVFHEATDTAFVLWLFIEYYYTYIDCLFSFPGIICFNLSFLDSNDVEHFDTWRK